MAAPTVSVSYVEDHARYAERLAAMLQAEEGFVLRGAWRTAEEALAGLLENPPDVALVDLQLPGLSGVDCIGQLAPQLPQTAFVVLTSMADDRMVFEALRAGAVGYLKKSDPAARVLAGIRSAAEGDSPISPGIARLVVQHFATPMATPDLAQLSKQESVVLRALASGQRYKEISASLSMNEHTLRTYIRRVYQKLAVTSRTEAVARYLRESA